MPVAQATTGERILATAAEMTAEVGWSGVTMAALAERVGVSRQTVYNEWGSRDRLAEAMVLREPLPHGQEGHQAFRPGTEQEQGFGSRPRRSPLRRPPKASWPVTTAISAS